MFINKRTIRFYKDNTIQMQRKGSGALSGKMLLVRIAENNKINAYFRAG